MCDVGVTVRVGPGVFAERTGRPIRPEAMGIVIGHVGDKAIVSLNPPEPIGETVLVRDVQVRPIRGSGPKPVAVMPGGAVHPLNRTWPRARTRKR